MLHNRLAKLREEREGEHGFTLIELLVVVVIIGILIAIAIPVYLNYTKNGHDAGAQTDLRNAVSTLQSCQTSDGSFPATPTGHTFANAAAPCTGQTITLTNNTTLTYFASADSPPSAFVAEAVASDGSGNVYCYSSSAGGSVQKASTTVITGYPTGGICPAV